MSDHHIERCDEAALAVYLFLVTVAEAQGLSYYGDAKLAESLSMPAARLDQARADLIRRIFPMLSRMVHDKPLAYLDNGASAQRPNAVLDAVDDKACC